MSKLIINLCGRLSVCDENNNCFLPSSQKQLGLIALLATSENLERGRTWLQDKLWSDRAQDHGASSLRQAVHQAKKALGHLGDILHSNRTSIGLDPTRTEVVLNPERGEFLEGIDIRDDEFEDWLRDMRSSLADHKNGDACQNRPPENQAPRKVILNNETEISEQLAAFSFSLIDQVSLSLRESYAVEIGLSTRAPAQDSGILVSFLCIPSAGDTISVRITAEDLRRNTMIASDNVLLKYTAGDQNLDPAVLNLCNRIVEAVQDYSAIKAHPLPYDTDAALLANIAIRKIFSICPEDLASAETLLKQAYEIEPRGLYQAWRAQALVIKHIERFGGDYQSIAEEADALCASALATEPNNSQVLAAVSNARCMIERNIVAGLELAKLAVRTNVGNPLAWWSLSNAFCYAGKSQMAYDAAQHSHRLAMNTRMRFWTDIQRALTAIPLNKGDEAIGFCELSSALAPNFRPPKRYLAALYADRGDIENARNAVSSLSSIEKGFSLEQMQNDPEYPVGLMRLNGLTDSLQKIA